MLSVAIAHTTNSDLYPFLLQVPWSLSRGHKILHCRSFYIPARCHQSKNIHLVLSGWVSIWILIRFHWSFAQGCNTTYSHNYHITAASQPDAARIYYGGIPEFIQVSEHVVVESSLIVLFENQMAFSQWAYYPDHLNMQFTSRLSVLLANLSPEYITYPHNLPEHHRSIPRQSGMRSTFTDSFGICLNVNVIWDCPTIVGTLIDWLAH